MERGQRLQRVDLGPANLRSWRPDPHPNRTDRGAGATTSRSARRPPLNSRFATRAPRSGDFAPVEHSRDFQRRVAAACSRHRSAVRPIASDARKGSRRIAVPGAWRRHVDDGRGQCVSVVAETPGD